LKILDYDNYSVSNGVLIMYHKWTWAATYIGAGVGLVIFAFFGLLPGSFLGGAIGLNIAGRMFGSPLVPTLFPKVIISVSMAFVAVLFGVVIIFIFAVLGNIGGLCLMRLAGSDTPSPETAHLNSKNSFSKND
jgi:predicted cobalt transporter CbtA